MQTTDPDDVTPLRKAELEESAKRLEALANRTSEWHDNMKVLVGAECWERIQLHSQYRLEDVIDADSIN